MIRRPPRSTQSRSSAASDVYKRQDYGHIVELVDFLYQDIAQPKQAEIAITNAEMFLRTGGYACIMIKARSIDVTAKPKAVYKGEVKKLGELLDIMYVLSYTHLTLPTIYS